MDSPSPTHHGFLDANGAIAKDHECKRCGYNLRTLKEDGRCPECGTPVGLSTQGDLLRFADPDWVEKVARGLTIILWMMLIGIIVVVLAAILSSSSPAVTAILNLATGAVAFYGVWLMTEPDPSGIGEDPNLTARKVIRITLVVGIVGQASSAIAQAAPGGSASGALAIIGIAAVLVSLAGEFAKYIFYERIALRIPDVEMAERAHFLKWAYPITLGIMLLAGSAAVVVAYLSAAKGTGKPSFGGSGMIAFGCVGGIAGLALLVFGVMTISLLIRLRREIAEQARRARETWAAATASTATSPSPDPMG